MQLLALCLVHPFQFRGRVLESSIGPVSDGADHFQIREHLRNGTVREWELGLALGSQKQLGPFENALPDLG
jgi:hypothetical protein